MNKSDAIFISILLGAFTAPIVFIIMEHVA